MRLEAKTHKAWEFTLDEGAPQTVTLSANLYFDDLLTELQSELNSAGFLTYTVSEADGHVTISADGSFDIHWDDFALARALGFDDDLSSTSSYASPNHAYMIFYAEHVQTPNVAPWDGWIETDMRAVESPTGHVHAMYGSRKKVNQLTFPMLTASKTWIANEETQGESLERFYLNWILGEHEGGRPAGPIRIDGDRRYKVVNVDDFNPSHVVDNWAGRWTATFPRLVKLP